MVFVKSGVAEEESSYNDGDEKEESWSKRKEEEDKATYEDSVKTKETVGTILFNSPAENQMEEHDDFTLVLPRYRKRVSQSVTHAKEENNYGRCRWRGEDIGRVRRMK